MSLTPSPFQTAIFSWARTAQGNLVIDAKAGSGKTTTLVELLKCLPVSDPSSLTPPRIRFLAFNKMIAETLQRRCPRHVVCSTFHSLGLSALRGVLRQGFEVDAAKCRKLVWNALDRDDPDTKRIIQLVSLAKTLVPVGDASTAHLHVPWSDLITRYFLEFDDLHHAVSVASSVLRASNAATNLVDYDDMLYLPVLLNAPFDWQDWVLVDEAQDTNDIQVEILWRLRRNNSPSNRTIPAPFPGTRFVFVGDPHQAIYGFRGANSDAMKKITARFNAETLPLSVCYRCSRAVIREAQRTVPDILPWDSSPEGEVKTLVRYTPSLFTLGSAILCRNTAPLVAHAYALLTRDIPCVILGKDIGASLAALVKKMRASHLPDLIAKLLKWSVRESQRAITEGRSPETIVDQHECILFFISSLDEDSQTIPDLLAKIDLMFSDTADPRTRVVLSTIHKAKGMEYRTVFILDRGLLPSKYATQPWEREQERNLLYVAQTRAQETLVYISSDSWEKEGAQ